MVKHKHNPFLWIPTMVAAEEIPTAVITFVALLMFLQFGETMGMSALYSSLLFLPYVLRSFLRKKVRSAANFTLNLHISECLIFLFLIIFKYSIQNFIGKVWILFSILFIISSLCAWHDLLGRMYYDRMLYPRMQKIFNKTKIFASQITQVLTYGVLIMFIGFLEVIFRMPTEVQTKQLAWSMECYIIAGVFMVFMLLNFMLLKNPRIQNPYRYESMRKTFQAELYVIERIKQKRYFFRIIIALFFLLLPQSLMFYTRVFFLLSSEKDGGLGCSIPELGFAQGTIGVIAFGVGVLLGRYLLNKYNMRTMFWWMAIPLTLSPAFYMMMAHNPLVDNFLAICCMCLLAQLFFGFGLNICLSFVRYISGERYRNTIGYFYIPLIAGAMIVPMALSGWLCQQLGFKMYFIIDASSALIAWLLLLALGIRSKLAVVDNKQKLSTNTSNE